MKLRKTLNSTFALLSLVFTFSASTAQAEGLLKGLGIATTMVPAAPFLSTYHIFNPDECSGGGGFLCGSVQMTSTGEAVTTTLILLKEIKTAQPDALDYATGGAPSPLLYSIAEKVQNLAFEITGREIGFDEAVNEIISLR